MRKKTLLATLVFITLMVARLPAAFASDLVEVQTPDGRKQIICDIVEETYKYIEVESDDEKVKLYTDPEYAEKEEEKERIVSKVEHGQKPPKYARAWGSWKSRKYGQAFKQFGEAGSEVKGDNKWLGAYIYYYAGEAAFNEAKFGKMDEEAKTKWYGEAADKYGRLVNRMPDHYFVPKAAVGLARSQIRLNEYDEAQDTIKDILDSDYPERQKKRARVWEGRLFVERGDYDRALDKLEKLSEDYEEETPELAYLAKMGEGYAWQGKENYREAEDIFRRVGLRSPDNAMRAEAFNSRGLSLMKRGQIREALFSFLRVVILHQDIRQEYQKALFYAAVTSNEYYSDAPQRARELAKKLKSNFSDSYWTKKLKEEHPDLLG